MALVVGAGISGIACAAALADAGQPVQVLERSRAIGGRMASRTLRGTGTRWDGRVVDIGASYFTISDPAFRAAIEPLITDGTVRSWTDTFHVAGTGGIEGVTTGPMRYSAPAGLRSVVAALAPGHLHIEHEREVGGVLVDGPWVTVDGLVSDRVALCMPGPQAARICPDLPVDATVWEPVLAVTCVFAERSWSELDGVFVNDDPVLTWIADDGARRGDDAAVLVAHVHPVLSAGHLDDPSAVIPNVLACLQRVLGMSALPEWVDVHRWTFDKPLQGRPEDYWLHDDVPLGLAGDVWAGGPRVEAAWLSGSRLGQALGARDA